MVLLAVRMVADVTETRNVIPSLEFKTCMTIIVSYLNVLFNLTKSYCIIRTFLLCKWSLTINY